MNNRWEDLFGSEWEYIKKLGSCFHDPEEKKAFWEMVKGKKLADSQYSIYSDFPRDESATKKAMRECCGYVFGLRKLKREEIA